MRTTHKVIIKLTEEMKSKMGAFHLETSHNPTEHSNIEATIVSIPENISDNYLYSVYEGRPAQRPFVGHDKLNRHYGKMGDTIDVAEVRRMYRPTTYEEELVMTIEEHKQVRVGDTVFIHYLATGLAKKIYDTVGDHTFRDIVLEILPFPKHKKIEIWHKVLEKLKLIKAVKGDYGLDELKEVLQAWFGDSLAARWNKIVEPIRSEIDYKVEFTNYIKTDEFGYKYYLIDYSMIHAVKHGDTLMPLNGRVLLSKKLKEVKKRSSGIIDPNLNKHEQLHGIVEHLGVQVGVERRDISKGDTVIYQPVAEFKQKIEDKEYFMAKYWDIVAKVVDDEVIPLGKYVLCKPLPVYHSKLVIDDPVENGIEAQVVDKGDDVDHVFIGDQVGYRDSKMKRSSSFLYLNKYDLFFIREEDILYKR